MEGGGGDLDRLVEQTKTLIGQIIQKPKMTEKLLQKPPFRFIHDTISAVMDTTQFGVGLYSGDELDSSKITEKQAKIDYLEKIFSLVSICKGAPIDVRAAKLIAGLEPECTNVFLIALAEVATDDSIDSAEAVQRSLRGDPPGSIPRKGGRKNAAPAEAKDGGGRGGGGGGSKGEKSSQPEPAPKAVEAEPAALLERGKSRGGTRGGKPTQASTDTGLARSSNAPNLDVYIERCDGTEAVTKELLGALITKPSLTDKLLQKPPVRFLHDVVTAVIRATGFGEGLYTPEELDSANVTEKQQKIDFLEKIIKLVGVQLNTLVDVQPLKIVAGLDASNTNRFLQLLAVAAKYAPDSTQAVRTVLEIGGGGGGGSAPQPTVAAPAPAPAPSRDRGDDRKAEEKPRRAPEPAPAPAPVPVSEPKEVMRNDDRREIVDDNNKLMDDLGEGDESKKSTRPTTARRRPPKVKDGAKELTAKDVPAPKRAEGILIDGQADEDEEEGIVDDTQRLADVIKADSKGGPSADPQSKLVKDILSRQAEQEAAARKPKEEDKVEIDTSEMAGSGVRLGRKKTSSVDKTKAAAVGVTGLGESDIERMRASIQALVQHTGPLGTCMDFIQEDVGLMTAELHRWEEECRKYEALSETERLKTQEALQPLQSELSDIEEQIADKLSKISSLKSSIAKNEDRMQQMLKLMVSA